jgi:SAM-dependent methyltransferase
LDKGMTQTKRDYVYDQGFAEERKRLAAMEALWDSGSQALLDDLGIGTGWKCLEVGAGGGSLVEWMVQRGAVVTAVDIDTRFIEHLASDAVDVRRLDIRTDELPDGEFDLVHARLVLEHLTDRRQILDRLVATLRPGGWLMIEDYDFSCFGFEDPSFDYFAEAIMRFMEQGGYQRDYGRRVVRDLEDAGLIDVRGDGRARLIDSTSPGFDFFRLSFESLKGPIVDTGMLTAEDAEAASARFGEDMRVWTPLMMAGIGRRA